MTLISFLNDFEIEECLCLTYRMKKNYLESKRINHLHTILWYNQQVQSINVNFSWMRRETMPRNRYCQLFLQKYKQKFILLL